MTNRSGRILMEGVLDPLVRQQLLRLLLHELDVEDQPGQATLVGPIKLLLRLPVPVARQDQLAVELEGARVRILPLGVQVPSACYVMYPLVGQRVSLVHLEVVDDHPLRVLHVGDGLVDAAPMPPLIQHGDVVLGDVSLRLGGALTPEEDRDGAGRVVLQVPPRPLSFIAKQSV